MRHCLYLAICALVGCSTTVKAPDPGKSDKGKDINEKVVTEVFEEEMGEETLSEIEEEVPTHSLSPCETPQDCQSGICVLGGDSKHYCAPSCAAEPCPEGWKCTQVQNVGGDTVIVCLPSQTYLCRPCKVSDDCKPQGVKTSDICIEFGQEGSFCGRDCSGGGVCPEGYECKDVSKRDMGTFKQCMPISGVCDCTEEFVLGGYETICYKENQYGKCEGTRKCSQQGLTECSAKTPSPEECNGIDDDCDGNTDEELITGECEKTFGNITCKGPKVCENGQLVCKASEPSSEKCGDGIDNDCNGATDEEGAENCSKYYYDKDGDGFGTTEYKCLCGASDNFSAQISGDCNDEDQKINPQSPEKCDGIDNDCDDITDEEGAIGCKDLYPDADMDGFGDILDKKCLCQGNEKYVTTLGGDCNDQDHEIHPGVEEKCDQQDNNCDGNVDEEDALGCDDFFKDLDGDGYGIAQAKKCLCGPSGVYTGVKTGDCDDEDKTINPNAMEMCNAKDDDCDGFVDEEDALGCKIYYLDKDGDGFGMLGDKGKCLCNPEGQYTAISNNDCEDEYDFVNPSAKEKCSNLLDDDCDGEIDEEGGAECATFYKDEDKDGWGVSGDFKCYCSPSPPYTALKSGDCVDNDPKINPGVIEVCGNGVDENCNNLVDEENASGCVVYYKNEDGDLYGLENDKKCLCAPTGVYNTTIFGDCNDSDPEMAPGLPEKCGDNKDNDCNGSADDENAQGCKIYYRDGDKDTYGVDNDFKCLCVPSKLYSAQKKGDCNDNDPNINPGQNETCNNLDDNCNGIIDDEGTPGCQIYFRNLDNDGYGLANDSKCLCAPQGQYNATQPGDCDDNDPNVYPQAKEQCNKKDDDCNGVIDDEGTQGCKIYYFDNDGDGWGIEGNSKCYCEPTGKYTAQKGNDCMDNDPNVNPGQLETCGNNKDDNCDGKVDEEGAQGCQIYYLDNDSDGYGTTDGKCLCQPSGGYKAILSGDCNDNDSGVNPKQPEICLNGKDDNCNGDQNDEGAVGCQSFLYDGDNDGYGVTGMAKCYCQKTGKYTAVQGGDCNDNDPAINPGKQETCFNPADEDCDGDPNEEGALGCTQWYLDNDNDGYGTNQSKCYCSPKGIYKASKPGDCDDNNAQANPSVGEKCDNIDNNCNGQIDEEGASQCTNYYVDNDNDGYGSSQYKCLCKSSWPYTALQSGDCNDNDPQIAPNKTELCGNQKDDNCNGSIDEEGAQGCKTYYYDGDSDGYGSSSVKCLCNPSGKYTATVSGDCNDSNNQVYPNALEKCDNIDNNCNGQIDEGQNNSGCTSYYYDGDSDGWGTSSFQCLCKPSGSYKATKSGDCNDNNSNVYPGATETCDNLDNNCDGKTDEPFWNQDWNGLDFPNNWVGPTVYNCTSDSCTGSVSGRILPKGDVDWLAVYKKETSNWISSLWGEVWFTSPASGIWYTICICWTQSSLCDQSSKVCQTSKGSTVNFKVENGDSWGSDDSAWLDIQIMPQSVSLDFSCTKWSLTWSVYE